MKIQVKVTKLDSDLPLPSYATLNSSGMDLLASINEDIKIEPGKRILVPTGIAIALPIGYEGQIRPRSGLALKHGVTVLNSPGTIDSDYRGEICVILVNLSQETFIVSRATRIAQLVISSYTPISWNIVEELPNTERGSDGFGSTGML